MHPLESGPAATLSSIHVKVSRSRSPAKRKPAGGEPEACQGVPGEALPLIRQAPPRPGEDPLHDLDRILGEARLPEPRPRLRPGTPSPVGESLRQGPRRSDHVGCAVAVLHTGGMHLHGDRPPIDIRRGTALAPRAFLPPSQPLGRRPLNRHRSVERSGYPGGSAPLTPRGENLPDGVRRFPLIRHARAARPFPGREVTDAAADPPRRGGRPASCKGSGFRCPKAWRFHQCHSFHDAGI